MGGDRQVQHYENVERAVQALIAGGYAEECEVHSGMYFESGAAEDELFDKIVNDVKAKKLFRDDEVDELFDEAKRSIGIECGSCHKDDD